MNPDTVLSRLRRRARRLKAETYALYLAARDPRVPWYAKLFLAAVVAYAASPIDLIPDFVPVLGYLDDLILVPLGIAIALKLVPPPVMAECRQTAQARLDQGKLDGRGAALVIVGLWLLGLALVVVVVLRLVVG